MDYFNVGDEVLILGRAVNQGLEFELELICLDDGSKNSRGLTIFKNVYNNDIFKLHIDTNSLYHDNLVLFADDIIIKKLDKLFYRVNKNSDCIIFNSNNERVTKFSRDMNLCYPINSDLSAYYEHKNGIVLSAYDCQKLNIKEVI